MRDGSFRHRILDAPVNARGLAAMRRGDVLAGEQAVGFHPRQQSLGSVRRGHDTGTVDIAGRDVIYRAAPLPFLWFEALALHTVIQQFEDFILDLGGSLATAAGEHIQLRVNEPLNDRNRVCVVSASSGRL